MNRTASALVGASLIASIAGFGTSAFAADMPTKAPPVAVAPTVPLDVHGFVEYDIANTRVTGGGMLLYNRGTVNHVTTGVTLDLYKNPNGFINGVQAFGGVWNETWNNPPVGASTWQEMDWWVGFNVKFAQRWLFSAQMLDFILPHGTNPVGNTMYNYVVGLAFDDSGGALGLPFALNPYVYGFIAASGPSTVALGKNGSTYRFDVGIQPSFDMSKTWGVPVTFTIPVWATVGPREYWNRQDGTTNFCGPTSTGVCDDSNVGYFATGLRSKWSLASLVPTRLGNWYLRTDAIYYHVIADSLLGAQVAIGTKGAYPNTQKDIGVFTAGIGFSY
jgi:hypothetical protein